MSVRILAAAAVLGFTTPAGAQGPPGTPMKSGKASLTVGGKPVAFDRVQGSINDAGGYLMAGLSFGPATGDNFQVSVMVKGPGKVDLGQSVGNGVGYRKGGKIFQNEKGKGACTVTLTKISRTEIEGTADCPGMKELNGSGTESLSGAKFSASAS